VRLGIAANSPRPPENLHHPQSVSPAVILWLEDECVLVSVLVMPTASVSYITLLSFAETSASQ
jgi:hypothetical protein